MNRQDATNLIQRYKDFPHTDIFGIKPYNYPLFHLLECFSKGWRIDRISRHSFAECWCVERRFDSDVHFNSLAVEFKRGLDHNIWTYVARNPNVTNADIGFVQQDLYARYVGKCNPLKTSQTTWGYTPLQAVQENRVFFGHIGHLVPLYCLEIDLDTTDIIGKRDTKLPWHYLQQTINWKPFTDRIDWNQNPA